MSEPCHLFGELFDHTISWSSCYQVLVQPPFEAGLLQLFSGRSSQAHPVTPLQPIKNVLFFSPGTNVKVSQVWPFQTPSQVWCRCLLLPRDVIIIEDSIELRWQLVPGCVRRCTCLVCFMAYCNISSFDLCLSWLQAWSASWFFLAAWI